MSEEATEVLSPEARLGLLEQRINGMSLFIKVWVAALFASLVFIVILMYILIGNNTKTTKDIADNTHRIAINAYKQCTALNKGFAGQNKVLDVARDKELAKPNPSAESLASIEKFRPPIQICGDDPRKVP